MIMAEDYILFKGGELLGDDELDSVDGGIDEAGGKPSVIKIQCPVCHKNLVVSNSSAEYITCSCKTRIKIIRNPF